MELDDDTNYISSILHSTDSSTKSLTCKLCSEIFSTKNDLLDHNKQIKGKIGGCTSINNVKLTTVKKKAVDLTPEKCMKKKQDRSQKLFTISTPVPVALPLCNQILPEPVPIIYKPTPLPILPSLCKILVDQIEPEYPCTICGETFRYNIGLICHLSSEHIPTTILKEQKPKKKKNDNKDNKPIENGKPNLTLSSDLKTDNLLNKMKSVIKYVYHAKKTQIICSLCNEEFNSTKKAITHVSDKHILDKLECGYCKMKFVFQLKLRKHMSKKHKIVAVYKCDVCSKMINKEECELHLKKCKEKVDLNKSQEKNMGI